MTDQFVKKVGVKLFQKHLDQYTPKDPLYGPAVQDPETGKMKRGAKRPLPDGLSKRDRKILSKVRHRAHYLDKGFSVCGMRFGWTFIIGIIPMAGDVADITLNYFLVLRPARKAEIPDWLFRRMLLNNAISAGVGFIPLVGDVVLASFKANSRNAALLEEFLRVRGEEFLKKEKAENPNMVKPGAGREPGEVVNGKGKQRETIQSTTKVSNTEASNRGSGRSGSMSFFNRRKKTPNGVEGGALNSRR